MARRDILDATLRAFVSEGSGISIGDVIEGQRAAESPGGLYAAIYLISEQKIGRRTGFQYIGEDESFTVEDVMVESLYNVEFYRDGALDAAFDFSDWAFSETGVNWSSTAITDGRIKGANVYAGGSGYSDGDICEFDPIAGTPLGDIPSQIATGRVVASPLGAMERIVMTNFGAGYFDMPVASVSGSGSGAAISPRGFGFALKHPITVRNLTGMIADDFEPRAQIDLRICHTRNFIDRASGRVEQIIQDTD